MFKKYRGLVSKLLLLKIEQIMTEEQEWTVSILWNFLTNVSYKKTFLKSEQTGIELSWVMSSMSEVREQRFIVGWLNRIYSSWPSWIMKVLWQFAFHLLSNLLLFISSHTLCMGENRKNGEVIRVINFFN